MRAAISVGLVLVTGCSFQFTQSKAEDGAPAHTLGSSGSSGSGGSTATTGSGAGSGGSSGSTGSGNSSGSSGGTGISLFSDGGAPLVLASGQGFVWTALDGIPDGGVAVAGVDDGGLTAWALLGADGTVIAGPSVVDTLNQLKGAREVAYLYGDDGGPEVAILDESDEVVFVGVIQEAKLVSRPVGPYTPQVMIRSTQTSTSVGLAESQNGFPAHIDTLDSAGPTNGYELPAVTLPYGAVPTAMINALGGDVYDVLLAGGGQYGVVTESGTVLCSVDGGFSATGLASVGSAVEVLATDATGRAGTIPCMTGTSTFIPAFPDLVSSATLRQLLIHFWDGRNGRLSAYLVVDSSSPSVSVYARFAKFAPPAEVVDALVGSAAIYPDGGTEKIPAEVAGNQSDEGWLLNAQGVFRWQL